MEKSLKLYEIPKARNDRWKLEITEVGSTKKNFLMIRTIQKEMGRLRNSEQLITLNFSKI